MPAWWSILVIVALVGFAGGLYLHARGDRTDTRRADHERASKARLQTFGKPEKPTALPT
jgi:hypothetical protein